MKKALILLFVNLVLSERLRKYNVDPHMITVSGISSGAAMASQFHFAYSSEVSGAGIVSGVPYTCGVGGTAVGSTCILFPALVNIDLLVTQAEYFQALNLIDSVANIENDKVFIFHGSEDGVIQPGSGRNVEAMYAHFKAKIETEYSIPAQHGWPTSDFGAPCSSLAILEGFFNNCTYNTGFHMLNYLYGGLTLPEVNAAKSANLLNFDQAEFFRFTLPIQSSMDRTGFVYVPTECQGGAKCRLHISFHGCLQSRGNIGNAFAIRSGIIEVAEINNIIVLFPQIAAISVNPEACWDWFGYLNTLFPTRDGFQVLATYRMMSRIVRG